MWRAYRQRSFQSSDSPVVTIIDVPVVPPPPPPPPPSTNDPFPFKLYRSGSQIRESAALYTLVETDFGGTAQSGDTIKVAPGTYVPQQKASLSEVQDAGVGLAIIDIPNLTIEWLVPGLRPVIDHSLAPTQSRTWFITQGPHSTNLTVRGLDVRGAYFDQNNQADFINSISGAGLCNLRSYTDAIPFTLTVEDCAMREFSFGIQTSSNWNGVVVIRRCLIECGRGPSYLPHGIYIADNASLTVDGCLFRRLVGSGLIPGHLLKSRSRSATVRGNFFDGRNTGAARAFDYSNGGQMVFTGNIVFQGEPTAGGEYNGAVAFAPEQTTIQKGTFQDNRLHSVLVAQNTFVHDQNDLQPIYRNWGPVETPGIITQGFARGGTSTVKGDGTPPDATNTMIMAADCPDLPLGCLIIDDFGANGSSDNAAYGPHTVTAWDSVTKTATVGSTDPVTGYGYWNWTAPDSTDHYTVWQAPVAQSVPTTIRNNVAASKFNSSLYGAQGFVAAWPDNSKVNIADIDPANGRLLISAIPCSPSVADATLEFTSVLQAPSARSDTVRGGHSSLPSFVPAPGTIANISLNTLADVNPCPTNTCPYSPAEGQSGMFAWCSGARIKGVGLYGLIAHWGGGHNAYYGNEPYTFDFETRVWTRRKNPGLYGSADDGCGHQFLDPVTANPLVGYRIHTYVPGTLTPIPVYRDEACTIPHTNPIILDSIGVAPGGEVWTPAGVKYRWMVAAPSDTTPPSNPLTGNPASYWGASNNRMLNPWLEYDPGEPAAPHTYRTMFGLSPALGGNAQGTLVQVQFTNAGGLPFSADGAQRFDFNTGTTGVWSRLAPTRAPFNTAYGPACLDEVHGVFYIGGASQAAWVDRIQVLNIGARAYSSAIVTSPPSQFVYGANTMMDYCQALDCLVVIRTALGGASSANPQVWTAPAATIRAGTATSWTQMSTNTFSGTLSQSGHSINWAAFLGKFALYNGQGENVVYYLQPPSTIGGTWLWSSETFGGVAAYTSGNAVYDLPFSRFHSIDELKSFSWYSGTTGPVQLWRPAGT